MAAGHFYIYFVQHMTVLETERLLADESGEKSDMRPKREALLDGDIEGSERIRDIDEQIYLWGCSSVGRAPALQAGGHEFESHHLHSVVSDEK